MFEVNMNKLNIGDMVGWSSAAGYKEGKIKNIVLARTAADTLVPWIDIEYKIARDCYNSVRLCATEQNLKMMKVCLV
jgi:hypothetical protein